MSSLEFKKEYKHEKNLSSQIRKAYLNKDNQKIHGLVRQYLKSHSAKIVAVEEANQGLHHTKRLGRKKIAKRAKAMNVWEKCDETVRLIVIKKPNNNQDFRYIFNYGFENQARQILVRNVIKASSSYSPNQYLMNGGRDKAVQAVQQNYKQGYKYVIELDVQHCYKSFNVGGVSEFLSLPKEVTDNVLSGFNLNVDIQEYLDKLFNQSYEEEEGLSAEELFSIIESDWEGVRSGLPEGSKASPFAVEKIFSDVIKQLPMELGTVVNYADNFLCMCKDENDAFEMYKYLCSALHAHPAGPLELKTAPKVIQPKEGFEFLGYHLIHVFPNKLSCELGDPARRKWKRQRKSVYKKLMDKNLPNKKKADAVNEYYKKFRDQASGYQLWIGREKYVKYKMSRIVKRAKQKGVTDDMFDAHLLEDIKYG